MGESRAFAPGLDEQRHELPLRAARVLEFVNEHVVIARFEPVPALREVVHPPQQIERPQQQIREIEHRVRIERPAVLGVGDAEHPPDSARHQHVQIAAIGSRHPDDGVGVAHDEIPVGAPVGSEAKAVFG